MSFTVTPASSGAVVASPATVSITAAAGSTIVVEATDYSNATFGTVTDSGGNSYTNKASATDSIRVIGSALSINIANAITSITYTASGASSAVGVAVWAITGTGTISYADSQGNSYNFNTPNTTDGVTSGSMTLTTSDGLLLGLVNDISGGNMAAGTGFTSDAHFGGAGGTAIVVEHKAVAASAAATFTATNTNDPALVVGLALQISAAAPAAVDGSKSIGRPGLRLGTPLSRLRSSFGYTPAPPPPIDGPKSTPRAPGLRLGTPLSRLRSSILDSTDTNVSAILSGNAAAFTAGTLIDSHSNALTGQSALFTAGSFSHADSEPLTGQKATFSSGTLIASVAVDAKVLSRSPAMRIGTPWSRLRSSILDSTDNNLTRLLSGQGGSFTAGSLTPASSKALSAQSAAFSAGSVSPSISKALTGASASFSAGTVTAVLPLVAAQDGRVTMPRVGLRLGTPRSRLRASVFDSTDSNISAALSGVVLVSSGGSLKAAAAKALSGQSAAFAAGTIKPSVAVAASGQLASFTPGTLAVPGNVTAALTGVAAVFAAGTILVPSAASQDAGRKTRRRRQYIVRIDSQEFVCQSAAEAIELLRRAKEAAQLFALKQVEQAKIEGGRVKLPTIAAPSIHARSAELREIVTQTRQEIAKVYRDTLINTEIMMLFELERRNIEDDNDSIALLL